MKRLKICKMCGLAFISLNKSVMCKTCKKKDEKTFKEISNYISENPGANINELAARFNLNLSSIKGKAVSC